MFNPFLNLLAHLNPSIALLAMIAFSPMLLLFVSRKAGLVYAHCRMVRGGGWLRLRHSRSLSNEIDSKAAHRMSTYSSCAQLHPQFVAFSLGFKRLFEWQDAIVALVLSEIGVGRVSPAILPTWLRGFCGRCRSLCRCSHTSACRVSR